MRIGIDMRMAGTGEGIARYVEELAKHLQLIDSEHKYFMLIDRAVPEPFPLTNANFCFVRLKSPYYSWAEQTRLPRELGIIKPDLAHFPNFNFPLLYRGKFVTTIHDLIHHLFPGKKKSRWLHRMAYRYTIASAVRRSEKVITVSEATKKSILHTFSVPASKISVIYEAAGEEFHAIRPEAKDVLNNYGISKPYILFVGVWRQYKNVPLLARAFDILKEQGGFGGKLVLVGKIDPFYPEIMNEVMGTSHSRDILALDHVAEADLPSIYRNASVFVLPSLVEGFGLTALEAISSGVPVIASDIPVLREILRGAAVYFDPNDRDALASVLTEVLTNQGLRSKLIADGQLRSGEFSWSRTARETLNLYNEVMNKI